MSRALVSRQEQVLRILVQEYIARATPVASETLVRSYKLGVSPATVRNYMAQFEEEGYITRPHTSAGSVPLGKAYRHYVQSLAKDLVPEPAEQRSMDRLFRQAGDNADEWARLAATLLARLVRNIALVTSPKAARTRLKHLQLVGLTDHVALLVVVLQEIRVKQQLVHFAAPLSQDELTRIANKLNVAFALLTGKEIATKKVQLSHAESQVVDAVLEVIADTDRMNTDRPYLEGVRFVLTQPEFALSERMLTLMQAIEDTDWLKSILSRESPAGEVEVFIGDEAREDTLHDLSLVFSRYGIPDEIGGAVGVLGPVRMDYPRSIATVRYVAKALSRLLEGLYEPGCKPNE